MSESKICDRLREIAAELNRMADQEDYITDDQDAKADALIEESERLEARLDEMRRRAKKRELRRKTAEIIGSIFVGKLILVYSDTLQKWVQIGERV